MTHDTPPPRPQPGSGTTIRYDAAQLIPNGTTAEIALSGQIYTLRITRAGKLILTK